LYDTTEFIDADPQNVQLALKYKQLCMELGMMCLYAECGLGLAGVVQWAVLSSGIAVSGLVSVECPKGFSPV
jgi:hypothetical protein